MRQARVPAVATRKRNGAYYTPDALAAMLVRWAVRSSQDRLLDPSCGDGRFLVSHRNSVGVERTPEAVGKAKERAPEARVCQAEFFAWAEQAHRTGERFDCVVGNPPFIRYQTWGGDVRQRALSLCGRFGVVFSGLAASWAPFLVVAANLLRPGGRMAFVVPAAFGHAPYAGPLVEHLVAHFRDVRIVAVRRKLFPRLSEDCWLLFADGFGGSTPEMRLGATDAIRAFETPPRANTRVAVAEWRSSWSRRLRPYLLSDRVRSCYLAATRRADAHALAAIDGASVSTRPTLPVRLGAVASVALGYVSGANRFFHLTPSEATEAGIPSALLQATVRSARVLPRRELTQHTVDSWRRSDDPMLLLRIPKSTQVPARVQRYLDSDAGVRAREAYKCRHRSPWYSVPDVRVPDFFLTYMAGRAPNLVKNAAGATCSNALHAVQLRQPVLSDAALLRAWQSPLTQLSCELEGHALGGGVLKLEPREAARVILSNPNSMPPGNSAEIEEAVAVLRSWRHYAK